MRGVLIFGEPKQPRSWYPWSSVKMMMKFGWFVTSSFDRETALTQCGCEMVATRKNSTSSFACGKVAGSFLVLILFLSSQLSVANLSAAWELIRVFWVASLPPPNFGLQFKRRRSTVELLVAISIFLVLVAAENFCVELKVVDSDMPPTVG